MLLHWHFLYVINRNLSFDINLFATFFHRPNPALRRWISFQHLRRIFVEIWYGYLRRFGMVIAQVWYGYLRGVWYGYLRRFGMDIFGGLVLIFAQVWYGYWFRLGMDICAGLVWIFAWVLVWKGVPGKGGWCYLQLLNIFLVIPGNKRSSFYFSSLIIPLTTS